MPFNIHKLQHVNRPLLDISKRKFLIVFELILFDVIIE